MSLTPKVKPQAPAAAPPAQGADALQLGSSDNQDAFLGRGSTALGRLKLRAGRGGTGSSAVAAATGDAGASAAGSATGAEAAAPSAPAAAPSAASSSGGGSSLRLGYRRAAQ